MRGPTAQTWVQGAQRGQSSTRRELETREGTRDCWDPCPQWRRLTGPGQEKVLGGARRGHQAGARWENIHPSMVSPCPQAGHGPSEAVNMSVPTAP